MATENQTQTQTLVVTRKEKSSVPASKRAVPLRTQLATLADAIRIHNFTTGELVKQLAQMDPQDVDQSYINAYMLTSERLEGLLAQVPTLQPEIDPMAPKPIANLP